MSAPCLVSAPVAIIVAISLAFFCRACNWVLLLGSMGDFQCPSVLCGSFGCFGGMGISVFDSESCIRRWRSEESCTGTGVPFGLKVKRSTWYEHFLAVQVCLQSTREDRSRFVHPIACFEAWFLSPSRSEVGNHYKFLYCRQQRPPWWFWPIRRLPVMWMWLHVKVGCECRTA